MRIVSKVNKAADLAHRQIIITLSGTITTITEPIEKTATSTELNSDFLPATCSENY